LKNIERVTELAIGGIETPCFFPSVSGVAKSTLSPAEHLQILVSMKHPYFLVSAFDVFESENDKSSNRMKNILENATEQGQIILMDSGVFEKKWLRGRWCKAKFYQVLKDTPCHLAFCYDLVKLPSDKRKAIIKITKGVLSDRKETEFNAIMPIVHVSEPKDLPYICAQIANELDSSVIAVPEREMGQGLLHCANTVREIRQTLNGLGKYIQLHILGVGSPLSILIYVASGADTFDGVDWCQSIVDYSTAVLHHTQHMDFFTGQSPYSSDKNLSYVTRLLAHNLLFYENWMAKIRQALLGESISKLIQDYLPRQFVSELRI
jgi:queuine/archaeosine tRNA-ribosyltransferase